MWLLFNYKDIYLKWINFIIQFFGFFGITIMLSALIFSLKDLIKSRITNLRSSFLIKYIIISSPFIVGLLGVLAINRCFNILPYFLITTFIGVFLEGLLGKFIKNIYGENFWVYYKKPLIENYTTFIAFPFWLGANLLAFIIFMNLRSL